jgi:hypothetical protein
MIGIVTLHNTNYKSLADVTYDGNKVPYAELHGYKTFAMTDGWSDNIYFDSIRYLIEVLENNPDLQWVWWLDCDAMITNFTKKLEDIVDDDYHIIMSTDVNGINAGSFFVRNSPEGLQWLKMIMSYKPAYDIERWPLVEQAVMVKEFDNYKHLFKIVSQKLINSYMYEHYPEVAHKNSMDTLGTSGQWEVGDFVLHIPARRNDMRIDIFNKIQIVR